MILPNKKSTVFMVWAACAAAGFLGGPFCLAQTVSQIDMQTDAEAAGAMAPVPAAPAAAKKEVSVGIYHQRVSDGYGDWTGQHVQWRGALSRADELIVTLEHAERFHETGNLLSAQWLRDLSDRWQAVFALTGTSGGTFWPASQFSAGLYSRLLADRNLVLGGRLARHVSRNDYRDEIAEVSAAWYTSRGWVFQGGLRRNRSSPGGVETSRIFGALSYFAGDKMEVSLSGSSGREGYQQGIGDVRVDFHSKEIALFLRYKFSPNLALDTRAVHYSNPFYKRDGLGMALVFQY